PDPMAAAVALRWAGALHHLALLGHAPWAGLWPPAGDPAAGKAAGPCDDAPLDAAIAAAWTRQRAHCAAALARPPQTNEVQRSAALLPGLLYVAAQTRLPIALLEIGASAGLNLWCDRYRHDPGAWAWGDPAAPLVLRTDWQGPPPPLQAGLRVASRAGCDAHPVDLAQPGEGLRLASFIWPDQPARMQRLQAAQAAAAGWQRAEGVSVQALPAARFVAQALQLPRPGQATVLMHSVVWQYIGAGEQASIASAMHAAGARATAAAPLAWLRLEPRASDGLTSLRCRLWPGGRDALLARCHPHGAHIEWLAGSPAGEAG
ncbi:MAG: DUF2332 family protein, partial [Burkholderiales bacterium]|nr:DUF2332 family protein [Burkholderiales bacterium]